MNIGIQKWLLIFAAVFTFSACASEQSVMQEEQQSQQEKVVEATSQETQSDDEALLPEFEPVPSGIYDNGRMWTFEYAPREYFEETYNFEATDEWFENARLGAVRLPNCSGSFISPQGLVMTNHHCARGQVSQVSREGESLLDNGFYAETLEDERRIEDYYVDQLIEIRDVTDQILDEVDSAPVEERQNVRRQMIEQVQKELQDAAEGDDTVVQVVSLYNGGRYSAYFFKRYSDIRLVMAPALQIGYFGGDDDNFTYPRYNLDMSFYRVYEDGKPLQTENFFPFSKEGVSEGDAVFMIGNPGSTTRLNTVAQLTYSGYYRLPFQTSFYSNLIDALDAYAAEYPVVADTTGLRNRIFGLKNGEKLFYGQLRAHQDPFLMGRRVDNEAKFIDQLEEDSSLANTYIPIIERIAEIQEEKAKIADMVFLGFGISPNSWASAATLQRAFTYNTLNNPNLPEDMKARVEQQILSISDKDPFMEKQLLMAYFNYLQDGLGENHPIVLEVMDGKSAEDLATEIMENSDFVESEDVKAFLNDSTDTSDPILDVVNVFADRMNEARAQYQPLTQEEDELQSRLGRAWFAVYGTSVPPDATFSLRISDGVVDGYEYNGTKAPAYTTFFGMYDRHFSHHNDEAGQWELPEKWKNAVDEIDLSTPVNFVSTNDIIGGNSGSPVVNKDLEVVGLAFDGNVESMGSSTFILDDRSARAVSVDVRGMLEAFKNVYNATRLVEEIESARD